MAMDRYHRQRIVPEIGDAGQRALEESRVLVLGVDDLRVRVAREEERVIEP